MGEQSMVEQKRRTLTPVDRERINLYLGNFPRMPEIQRLEIIRKFKEGGEKDFESVESGDYTKEVVEEVVPA